MILNIIIMNEALYMPTMKNSLINPNQLRHYQTIVKDDPYDEQRMWIEAYDGDLVKCLKSEGTIMY